MAARTPVNKPPIKTIEDDDTCSCFDCGNEIVGGLEESLSGGEEDGRDLTVKAIWREKMAKSYIFLPSDIEDSLPYWMEFIAQRCQITKARNAENFCIETAEVIAEQFKCYPIYGWECLVKTCQQKPIECTEPGEPETIPTEEGGESVSSLGSINDALVQADFLLNMVASNDFSLMLVKAALDPNFKPRGIAIKSPYEFQVPRTYLHLNREVVDSTTIRKNLLQGQYDDYLLPLAMANEVNERFWIETRREFYNEEFEHHSPVPMPIPTPTPAPMPHVIRKK